MSQQNASQARLALSAQRRVDEECLHFEEVWKAGQPVCLESYLRNLTEPERSLLLSELLKIELAYRLKNEKKITLEEYRRRFPQDLELVRAVFREVRHAGVEGILGAQTTRKRALSEDTGVDSQATGPEPPHQDPDQTQPAQKVDKKLPLIPGYEVLGILGRGGMGIVYEARDLRLKRRVALKMILAGEHADTHDLTRFRVEAEAVARLQHSHIVQIFEIGEHDGCPYFSLEFVDGKSLAQKIKGKPQPARPTARLVETLARAMHAAHQRRIVHRDLKPANVLLTADGVPKITDFGLAKRLDVEAGETRTGVVMGTPSYMAPEQASGENREIGPATDVYALGAILYEALTGRPPFRAATAFDTILKVLNEEPIAPRQLQSDIPRDLETICLKCLQKEHRKRYGSAEALADDLRAFLENRPIQSRPVTSAERLWRWCRRNPVLSSVTTVALTLLLLTGVMAMISYLKTKHAEALDLAVKEAQRKAQDALQATKKQAYLSDMASFPGAWQDLDLTRARRILEAHLPAIGETDQRKGEWDYLRTLLGEAESLRVLAPVSGMIQQAAWSPDGEYIACALGQGAVKVWHLATAQERLSLRAESGSGIPDLIWSPDSKQLAIVRGARILVYELAKPDKPSTIDPDSLREKPSRNQAFKRQVSWSPDSRRLASIHPAGNAVLVCEASTGQKLYSLPDPTGQVSVVSWSPDGRTIATAGEGGVLRLWKASTGEPDGICTGAGGWIRAVAWKPDSQELAFVTYLGSNQEREAVVKVWDLTSRPPQERHTLRCPDNRSMTGEPSPSLIWSKNGRLNLGRPFAVWDAASGRGIHTPLTSTARGSPATANVTEGLHDPEHHRLAIQGGRVLDVDTGREVAALCALPGIGGSQGSGSRLRWLAWNPEGTCLALTINTSEASGREEWKFLTWDIARELQSRQIWPLPGSTAFVWSPDSQNFLVQKGSEGNTGLRLRIGNVARKRLLPLRLSSGGSEEPATACALSPSGKQLALAYPERGVQVRDVQTGKVLAQGANASTDIDASVERMTRLLWSPSGKHLLSLSDPGSLTNWDPQMGRKRFQLEVGHGQAWFTWDADEKHLVVASPDGKGIRYLKADTGEPVRTAKWERDAPGQQLSGAACRPNSAEFAIAVGGAVHLWNPTTGKNQLIASAGNGPLFWSPDGQMLIFGTNDGRVRIWFAAEQTLGTLANVGNSQGVLSLSWNPDGRSVLLCMSDGQIKLVETATGQETGPKLPPSFLPTPQRPIRRVGALSPLWSNEGPQVAQITEAAVEIWNLAQGKPTLSLPQAKNTNSERLDGLGASDWSPGGERLATVTTSGVVILWDPATGERTASWPVPDKMVQQPGYYQSHLLKWSPDGKRLAMSIADRIFIRNTTSGDVLVRLAENQEPAQRTNRRASVVSLAWSPEGDRLASVHQDDYGKMRMTVWNSTTGQESMAPIDFAGGGRARTRYSLVWKPDGKQLAVGLGGRVKLFDSASGGELKTLLGSAPGFNNDDLAPDLSWSSNRIQASYSRADSSPWQATYRLIVWDDESFQEILTLSGPSASLLRSPDGRWVFTGSSIKEVRSP